MIKNEVASESVAIGKRVIGDLAPVYVETNDEFSRPRYTVEKK